MGEAKTRAANESNAAQAEGRADPNKVADYFLWTAQVQFTDGADPDQGGEHLLNVLRAHDGRSHSLKDMSAVQAAAQELFWQLVGSTPQEGRYVVRNVVLTNQTHLGRMSHKDFTGEYESMLAEHQAKQDQAALDTLKEAGFTPAPADPHLVN